MQHEHKPPNSAGHKARKRKTLKTYGGPTGNGWVKMNRSDVMDHIQARNPIAWCLLSQIAKRAWRGPGINQHGCHSGESFIGDYPQYNWTRMQYRVAKKVLEDFGQVTFRTTNRGTIAKLITKEIYDINVDFNVTDRKEQPSDSPQTAFRQPSDSLQAAFRQPSDSPQTATNKNVRSEEGKTGTNQEKKINNNDGADAPGVVVISPPSGDAGAIAPGEMPVVILTPTQKALRLSKELPMYLKTVCHLNQLPVFTQNTMQETIQYFQRNIKHEYWDALTVCALGIKLARENPADPDADCDPYFYSRRFASKPNKLYDRNKDDDLYLACIWDEVKYEIDEAHGEEWADTFVREEIALARTQPPVRPV